MGLVQLIYSSHFRSDEFESSELARIHSVAQKHNEAKDITGLLAFGEDRFLQCLEGERSRVNDLYLKIARDPRHRNPTLLSFREIKERQFTSWSMKLVLLGTEKTQLVRTFSTRSNFEPESMSAGSALGLLLALN